MDKIITDTLSQVLENMPSDWPRLTTHRLDIYNEKRAKVDFLEKFEALINKDQKALSELPTAYDYIRLGHPLSCILEWAIAKKQNIKAESVISFSSQSMPILAILRANKFLGKKTQIIYTDSLPKNFNSEILKSVYSYEFELVKVMDQNTPENFDGSTIVINGNRPQNADFNLTLYPHLGSVVQVLNNDIEYIKEIQHVRRRESIAMTPQNCVSAIKEILDHNGPEHRKVDSRNLNQTIQNITNSKAPVSFANCGLSAQYGIMMGLIHHALDTHKGASIKFIVPPNCYGGTNDQARRVASCIDNVEIVDLLVDSGKDMVSELERILSDVANQNAIAYIIAEIPTNPRVEIPDLKKLRETLKKSRKTSNGDQAVSPVFILDQTFCPNVKFFGENGHLHDVSVISYVSGSKFPSGGLCTAGYAVANDSAATYMSYVEKHIQLCDNSATDLQVEILTNEMPTMNERITAAYKNTRSFVDFIEDKLPQAKINFVSKELADVHFTPSVFSLDLPTKGETAEQRDSYKQILNHKLINMMIDKISDQSKHCVSYGQLKGSYWTIPATSTQGTTKESDKDYIVRVSIAADFDLSRHQEVFKDFVDSAY